MNDVIWSWRIKQKCQQYILSLHQQIVQLFCNRGSLEGAIKTINGTKNDLVFLSIKLLLNSTCPLIHSSILLFIHMVLYSIQWQASHGNWSCYAAAAKPAMPIFKNLHSMSACPVAMASFTTGTDRLQLCQLYIQKPEVISIEGIHIKSPMPRK
jgi:hypothetical protein